MSNPLEATFARFMGIFMNGWTKGMGKCPKKWNFGTFGTTGSDVSRTEKPTEPKVLKKIRPRLKPTDQKVEIFSILLEKLSFLENFSMKFA